MWSGADNVHTCVPRVLTYYECRFVPLWYDSNLANPLWPFM